MTQIQEKKLPEWWIDTTLGVVCEITSSKRIFAEEYKTFWVPFYRWKEIIEKFNWWKVSTELFITEEKYNEIKSRFDVPKEWEMLLTSVWTIWIPYIVKANEKFYFKDWNLTWFKNFKWISNIFLYFWLTSNIWKEEINKRKIWSTQQALTIVWLKSIPIFLPPLPTQKSIAKSLSSFDDKIELLREQNETLEKIGQEIFKEWFGKYKVWDMLPEGWRVGKLEEICEITSWNRPKNKSDIKNETHNIPLIWATKIMWYVEDYLYNEDIIVIWRVWTHWIIQRYYSKVWPSDNTLVIRSDNYIFTYQILKNIDFWKMNRWAVQPLITQTDLKNSKIIIPEVKVLDKFSEVMYPIFEKIKINSEEIQTLSKTRDELLPRLMKGEVLVENLENDKNY